MTPSDFHQRVYSGLIELQRQAYGAVDSARIITHPRVRAMLLMDRESQWCIHRDYTSREERYRGLVFETDPALGEDDIRIRYEVEA